MTRDEIDILWQKAMQESVKAGEMFTRYHFAKMLAAKYEQKIQDRDDMITELQERQE